MAIAAIAPAPANIREVFRCLFCGLNQYVPHDRCCRRCHLSVDALPEPAPPPTPATPENAPHRGTPKSGSALSALASVLRELRVERGWSQRELARRQRIPRTYVSKTESMKCVPTLTSLTRVAAALEISPRELLQRWERQKDKSRNDLAADPFISLIIPHLPALGDEQRRILVSRVAELAGRSIRLAHSGRTAA